MYRVERQQVTHKRPRQVNVPWNKLSHGKCLQVIALLSNEPKMAQTNVTLSHPSWRRKLRTGSIPILVHMGAFCLHRFPASRFECLYMNYVAILALLFNDSPNIRKQASSKFKRPSPFWSNAATISSIWRVLQHLMYWNYLWWPFW